MSGPPIELAVDATNVVLAVDPGNIDLLSTTTAIAVDLVDGHVDLQKTDTVVELAVAAAQPELATTTTAIELEVSTLSFGLGSGDPGGASSAPEVFVQDTDPAPDHPAVWFDTSVGGPGDFRIRFTAGSS